MILLENIIGHEEIVKTLQGAVTSGRIAHAHLFSGPKGVGKMTTAIAFARALVCSVRTGFDGCGQCSGCEKVNQGIHPEVRTIVPEGASIKISQVRQMTSELQFGPENGCWTVRIVDDVDTMTSEAGNSLLKILEEPLPGVVFILISTRPQAVLPTIVSRCQQVCFQPLSKKQILHALNEHISVDENRVQRAAALSGGSLGRAMELLSDNFEVREQALYLLDKLKTSVVGEVISLASEIPSGKGNLLAVLDMMILWFRDILLYNETCNAGLLINNDKLEEIKVMAMFYSSSRLIKMIEALESSKNSLAVSANIQLTIEALFLLLAGYEPEIEGGI